MEHRRALDVRRSERLMAHFQYFPATNPAPTLIRKVVDVFSGHEGTVGTTRLDKGLTSDEVLLVVGNDLRSLGFAVESGKKQKEKIHRPVFFGRDGIPTLKYEVDAYHQQERVGLEIEAGRAWMGNAIYRDLVQAMVMVEVDALILAVPVEYKYKSGGRDTISHDFENAIRVAETLYGHSRVKLPYTLCILGY